MGAALDHLRVLAGVHALDLEHVVVLGHSAGGHLALWGAARGRIPADGNPLHTADPLPLAGAVALAPVADLRHVANLGWEAVRRLMGGVPATHAERCAVGSPAELLALGVRQPGGATPSS